MNVLQVIARESPEPLASEFREVVEQQRLGVTLGEGLDRMCDRCRWPKCAFLPSSSAFSSRPAVTCRKRSRNLSGVLRDRFRMQLKIKALSAEAKASAMVLASLPPGVMFMVYMTSPDYIMPLFTTTLGRFMIVGRRLWMLTGVLVMRKMINFKF